MTGLRPILSETIPQITKKGVASNSEMAVSVWASAADRRRGRDRQVLRPAPAGAHDRTGPRPRGAEHRGLPARGGALRRHAHHREPLQG